MFPSVDVISGDTVAHEPFTGVMLTSTGVWYACVQVCDWNLVQEVRFCALIRQVACDCVYRVPAILACTSWSGRMLVILEVMR